jgi:probable HAF family extracellular repeat protein
MSLRLLLTILLACAAPLSAATFQPLGIGSGFTASRALDVSEDGSIVVGHREGQLAVLTTGFRWTAPTGLVNLPFANPQTPFSSAWSISPDGHFIGGQNPAHAYRWIDTSLDMSLGLYGAPPNTSGGSAIRGLSENGTVLVGDSQTPITGLHAIRWTGQDGLTSLGFLPGGVTNFAVADDVSRDGTIIVGRSSSSTGEQAFRWTSQTGMVGLGTLPGDSTSAAGSISGDGTTIVGISRTANTTRAFRWTAAAGMQDLLFPRPQSGAVDISHDGSIIAGHSNNIAVIWHKDYGVLPLQVLLADAGVSTLGWTDIGISALSADGTTVVGSGINPSGRREAFRAVLPAIVPEPSLAAPLVAGALLLCMKIERQRRLR